MKELQGDDEFEYIDGRGFNFDPSQKWLRRHCGDFYHLYCEAFLEQVLKMMHSDHILDYHVFTLTDI